MSMSGTGSMLRKWFFWLPLSFSFIWRLCKYPKDKLNPYWQKLSHFIQNIIVGVLIALLIHLGHGTHWVQDPEDMAMDWMNQLQVDTPYLASEDKRDGYTFIDMDEAAYQTYGEPYHIPRDKLLQLIRFAAKGEAQTIIVDVDLTLPGSDPKADQALIDFLSKYSPTSPNLILLRTFKPQQSDARGLATIRKTFFDNKITSPAIHWAQPRFTLDLKDHNIRRWRLVEAGCLDDEPQWVPSPQLLTVLLETQGREGWKNLAPGLNSALPADCSGEVDLHHGDTTSIKLAQGSVDIDSRGVQQRVLFSYSDNLKIGDTQLGYHRQAATIITENKQPPLSDDIKGKHVVIGASYYASHDIHQTPVGAMPGALIIVNAIKSLQQYGQLNGPPGWIKLLIEVVLITFMAKVFSHYNEDSLKAVFLIGFAFVLVLVPISFYVFRFGIWVDLAVPILGMQLHQVVADYESAAVLKDKLEKCEQERKSTSR